LALVPATTVTLTGVDVLPAKVESPLYVAVTECGPTARVDVVRDALPALTAFVPSDVAPSKNWTVPVAADGETVAVNVTLCPKVEEPTLDESIVVVGVNAALLTACVSGAEVLVKKLLSPLYFAVIECGPAASADVDSCAVPPLSAITPSDVAPSRNCTVPVALEGDTVAVNVTDCPTVDGFRFDATLVDVDC